MFRSKLILQALLTGRVEQKLDAQDAGFSLLRNLLPFFLAVVLLASVKSLPRSSFLTVIFSDMTFFPFLVQVLELPLHGTYMYIVFSYMLTGCPQYAGTVLRTAPNMPALFYQTNQPWE